MSHFTVLVIGENIEEQLSPFCENADLVPKEICEFEDQTDEIKEKFASDEKTEVDNSSIDFYRNNYLYVRDELTYDKFLNGEEIVLDKDLGFYSVKPGTVVIVMYSFTPKDGKKYENEKQYAVIVDIGSKKIIIRKTEVNLLTCKEYYKTLSRFAKEYYGLEINEDGKYGYWRNPQSKWDWYVDGGRWSGFFTLKNGKSGVLGEIS